MENFFAVATVVLSISFIWPQVWRSLRHNTTHRISPFGLVHGLIGATLWLSYGVNERIAPVAIANTSFVVAQTLIIYVAYKNGHIERRVITAAYPVVFAILILLNPVPSAVIGVIAVLISGSSIIPQFIHVLRTENLHGISLTSYTLTIITCVVWLLYGFVISDLMISAQNFLAIPILLFMTQKAWRFRRNNTSLSMS